MCSLLTGADTWWYLTVEWQNKEIATCPCSHYIKQTSKMFKQHVHTTLGCINESKFIYKEEQEIREPSTWFLKKISAKLFIRFQENSGAYESMMLSQQCFYDTPLDCQALDKRKCLVQLSTLKAHKLNQASLVLETKISQWNHEALESVGWLVSETDWC